MSLMVGLQCLSLFATSLSVDRVARSSFAQPDSTIYFTVHSMTHARATLPKRHRQKQHFEILEYVAHENTFVRSSFEIPFVSDLPQVIDARLANGRLKLNHRIQSRGAFFFIDLNNLNKINHLLGREVGDQYIRSVLNAIQMQLPLSAEVYRLGGDEFAIVTDYLTPVQIQNLTLQMERAVRVFAQTTLKPHIQQKGQEQSARLSGLEHDSPEREAAKFDFQNNFSKYVKASISVGAAYIDMNFPKSALTQAEENAKKRKIQIKIHAGLDVSKYGVQVEIDSNRKPRFSVLAPPELLSEPTTPGNTKVSFSGPISTKGKLEFKSGSNQAQGWIKLYEDEKIVVIEHFDDLHRSSFWIENRNSNEKVQMHASAVTGLPSLITPAGKGFERHFTENRTSPRARIEFKLSGLMYFNYFQDGVDAGDRALRILGEDLQKVVKTELKKLLRTEDIIFSGNGSDFVVFIENVSRSEALDIQKRILISMANNSRLQQIIEREVQRLQASPDTRELAFQIKEKLRPNALVTSEPSQFLFIPAD